MFITGANSGIGKATAERLARAGFTVIPGVRNPDSLTEPVKDPVTIDLADADSVGPACEQVLDRAGGRLVGLVNNAGISLSGPFETLPLAEWRRQFEVNVFGQLAVTQALLPALLSSRGRIVNIGSIGGRYASPFLGPYNASKFAVRAWSDSLRVELAPHGVHVALVEPGSIDTPLWGKGFSHADAEVERLTDEQRARYERQIGGARKVAEFAAAHGIPPDKVAKVVEHALSSARPKGRYLVGADAHMQAGVAVLPTRAMDRVTRLLLRQPGRA